MKDFSAGASLKNLKSEFLAKFNQPSALFMQILLHQAIDRFLMVFSTFPCHVFMEF